MADRLTDQETIGSDPGGTRWSVRTKSQNRDCCSERILQEIEEAQSKYPLAMSTEEDEILGDNIFSI